MSIGRRTETSSDSLPQSPPLPKNFAQGAPPAATLYQMRIFNSSTALIARRCLVLIITTIIVSGHSHYDLFWNTVNIERAMDSVITVLRGRSDPRHLPRFPRLGRSLNSNLECWSPKPVLVTSSSVSSSSSSLSSASLGIMSSQSPSLTSPRCRDNGYFSGHESTYGTPCRCVLSTTQPNNSNSGRRIYKSPITTILTSTKRSTLSFRDFLLYRSILFYFNRFAQL